MTDMIAITDGKVDTLRRAVAAGIACLDAGDLVVAPTETQYGLLGRADRSEVVAKVIRTKRRDESRPVSIFVRDMDKAGELATLSAEARCLGDRFLPGPLTILVAADESELPRPVVMDLRVGLRISSHRFMQAVMRDIDYPLTATSANLSGSPVGVSVDEIRRQLGSTVALYIDDGPLSGPPSTVVDAAVHPVRVLREGSISASAVAECLRDAGNG
ncbi:MAG: L-threonylcarbamoyladenylate synthase [bacterium]